MKMFNAAQEAAGMILSAQPEDIHSLNLPYIAEKLGVTGDELATAFLRRYDYSIREFILRTKAHHAAEMLINREDLDVDAIACMLGFSDTHSFIQVFREFYGTSPQRMQVKERLIRIA